MKRYVLGFIFNHNLTKVLLIEKKRGPSVVVGRWNGLGGEAADDEKYVEAMSRETREESGIEVPWWVRFTTVSGPGYQIACFYTVLKEDEAFESYKSLTDEEVQQWSVYPIVLAGSLKLAPGVTWMIEMARSLARGDDSNDYEVTVVGNWE